MGRAKASTPISASACRAPASGRALQRWARQYHLPLTKWISGAQTWWAFGPVSEQSLYHLANRTIEMEVIPAAEQYGIGVKKNNVALIRLINSVIDQRRGNGAWQTSYDKWLKKYLGKGTSPRPVYGR